MRSQDFRDEVIDLAQNFNISVELEGSILAHAFYLFKSAGLSVISTDLFEPKPQELQFNKLVRDRIPERIESHGEKVTVERLSGIELEVFLKAKVIEEALEVYHSSSNDELTEELADLMEVADALAKHLHVSKPEISSSRSRKLLERGGFEQGIVLRKTQETSPLDSASSERDLLGEKMSASHDLGRQDAVEGSLLALGVPKQHGDKVVIPPVPPPTEMLRSSNPIVLETDLFRLCITYGNYDIELEITPLSESGTADTNQLTFSFYQT